MNYKKLKYYPLLMLFVVQVFCSCGVVDDPIPVQVDSTAKFYFKAYLNGNFVKLKTDSNNTYMNTGFDYVNDSGYYRFYGNFAPEACTNCANSISFTVNDILPSAAGAGSHIDSLLKNGAVLSFNPGSNGSLGRIIIEYIDGSGKKYSSINFKQDYNFNIVYSKDYRKNKQEKKTKQVKAIFDCVLKAASDSTLIYVDNAEVVFSVAHP